MNALLQHRTEKGQKNMLRTTLSNDDLLIEREPPELFDASSDDEDMDFEDLKEMINNQHHSIRKTDLFVLNLLQDNVMTSTFAPAHKKIVPRTTPEPILAKTEDEEDAIKLQKKLKSTLSQKEAKILEIYALFEKNEALTARIKQHDRESKREDRIWKRKWGLSENKDHASDNKPTTPSVIDELEAGYNKDFVKFILSEMANIDSTKDEKAYKDLCEIDYITLVKHMEKHVKHTLHHLYKYTRFEDVQQSFKKHLYRDVLHKRMPHETQLIQIIENPPEEKPQETQPIQITENPPAEQPAIIPAAEEARVGSILDRIIDALRRLRDWLAQCWHRNTIEQPNRFFATTQPRPHDENPQPYEKKSEAIRIG